MTRLSSANGNVIAAFFSAPLPPHPSVSSFHYGSSTHSDSFVHPITFVPSPRNSTCSTNGEPNFPRRHHNALSHFLSSSLSLFATQWFQSSVSLPFLSFLSRPISKLRTRLSLCASRYRQYPATRVLLLVLAHTYAYNRLAVQKREKKIHFFFVFFSGLPKERERQREKRKRAREKAQLVR